MRKLVISLALASTAALAAPAAAQYHDPYRGGGYGQDHYGYQQGQQIQHRIYRLRERIQRLSQRGRVSRNEAYRLQLELDRIERRYAQYARNGLSQREVYELQQRLQNLQQQIREDRRDGRRYDDDRRYGDDRRYDRGYGDDRYDDGRYDDDRYDRD